MQKYEREDNSTQNNERHGRGTSTYHDKLAELEYLGEFVAHAERKPTITKRSKWQDERSYCSVTGGVVENNEGLKG